MKKLLCIALALSMVLACASTAVAGDLLRFEPEIIYSSSNNSNSDTGSSGNSGTTDNSGSGSVGGPSFGDSSNTESNGSFTPPTGDSNNTTDPNLNTPAENTPGTEGSADPNPNTPNFQFPLDGDIPLDAGVQNGADGNSSNTPPTENNLTLDPLEGGIEEEEIGDMELNGDAMHSLRIRANIEPGALVKPGDRIMLTAVPMGYQNVNYKIQWQTASVDENGVRRQFKNIPGAYGANLTIVFDKDNINNYWRAAIKIVE